MKKFKPQKKLLFSTLALFLISNLTFASDVTSGSQSLSLPPTTSVSALIEQSSYPAQEPASGKVINLDKNSPIFSPLSAKTASSNLAKVPGPTPSLVSSAGISLNTTYSATLNNTYNEIYATFTVTTATKFTSLLKQMSASNSNVDIYLYKAPTGSSSYTLVSQSSMLGASDEQLSEIATPGNYLLDIVAVGSVTGGSIQFGSFTSTGADSNEPDDNFWQAKSRAATFGLGGNLDNSADKDFNVFTLSSSDSINYRVVGGDYQAVLYSSSTLAPIFTLPNNTIGRLSVPAGTYYWAVKSPSSSYSSTAPYTFSAYHNVNNVTFNFGSDEGITTRVDWGSGLAFAFKTTASITGYAYDSNNVPARGAALKFTLTGSVGTSTVATTTTDATGFYSVTVSSPSGAGAHMFTGACNYYYYDIHNLTIQSDFGSSAAENVSSIKLIEGSTQTTVTGSQVPLNDVAYYVYKGC